jgi:hypothetical protein
MIGPGTIGIFGNSQDFFIATGKQIRSMRTHYIPLFLSKVKKYIHSNTNYSKRDIHILYLFPLRHVCKIVLNLTYSVIQKDGSVEKLIMQKSQP